MKPTSFKSRKIALLTLTGAAFLAFPTVGRAFVTLTSNQWVVTSGTGTSVVIAGTLTTNGPLIANGALNAGTLNASTVSTSGGINSTGQLWAKSTLYVTGVSTLMGNTTTQGDLSVYKGLDLGRAADNNGATSALQLDYYNVAPSLKTASFDLTDNSGNFRWQDNVISGTARPKMKLDASNVLTLYNTTGTPAVTITPATGKIDLMGATGAGLYSNSVPVIAVGSAGATSVTSSSLTVTGGSTTTTLNVSGATMVNSLNASGATTLNSLTVTGGSTTTTLNVSGATTVNSLNASGAATLNSLNVTGATVLSGQVIIATPQGDISMGLYGQ